MAINTYKILKSSDGQEPVTVQFNIPATFGTSPSVDVHIVTAALSSSGTNVRLRARLFFKGQGEDYSGPFDQTVTSDVAVTEPPSSGIVRFFRFPFTLSATGISGNDCAGLTVDRIAPTSNEYDDDIYIYCASFQFAP